MSTDDPRLTAYVLGELEPAEQAELEALLRDDPEATREVAELRELTSLVRSQLATEAAPPLGEEQKREILAEAQAPGATLPLPANVRPLPSPHRRQIWFPVALAACAAVMASYGVFHYDWSHRNAMAPEQRAETAVSAPRESVKQSSVSTLSPAPAATPAPFELAPDPSAPRSLSLKAAPPGDEKAELDATAPRYANEIGVASPSPMPLEPGLRAAGQELSVSGKDQRPVAKAGELGLTTNEPSRPNVPMASAAAAHATPAAAPVLGDLAATGPETSTAAAAKSKITPLAGDKPRFGAGTSNSLTAESKKMEGTLVELQSGAQPLAKAPAPVTAATPPPAPFEEVGQAGGRMASSAAAEGGERLRSHFSENTKPSAAPSAPSAPKERETVRRSWSMTRELELAGNVVTRDKVLRSDRDGDESPAQFSKERRLFQQPNTEAYDAVKDNAFLPVEANPLSTFSIDVDTASYANVRRFLTANTLPPKDAVRIEELVNYFTYQYPQPKGDDPFSVNMEVAACPWTPEHRLLRIGLKARELDAEKRPVSNLVFLIDVSGSMADANKLPLVKSSLRLLVKQLAPKDTVGIVVYAGASGTVLEPTSDKKEILRALDHLEAGGSTNGGAGIRLAYDLAKQEFAKEKTNRVILATDGDFNVGTTSEKELTKLITEKARSGTFLSVLGFGYGNLKDNTMEKLADKGNGNYAYIDTPTEGRKVLVEQMAGTLFTVAKDVKMQIEFNPTLVAAYRLIGYENRVLAAQDFNDDKKDAGEIGAGHTVTALYEIVPAGQKIPNERETTTRGIDALKYAATSTGASREKLETAPTEAKPTPEVKADAARDEKKAGEEMLTLKLRWKAPDGDKSTKREFPLVDTGAKLEKSSGDFRWAAAVASFGMLLRDSPYKGEATWTSTRELAAEGRGEKPDAYRTEFLELLKTAEGLGE